MFPKSRSGPLKLGKHASAYNGEKKWTRLLCASIIRGIITKLEIIKIGYRGELHDRFARQYPEMEISEQWIADQRRTIVTKGLLSNPWLEESRAQVAENFKEANVNAEEGTTQPTDEKEPWEDTRRLEQPPTAETP